MKLIFTLTLLAVIHCSLSAQIKLTGTIHDPSNHPLAYAGVSLLSTDNHKNQSLQTDSSGSFVFKNLHTGQYTITIASIGYEKYQSQLFVTKDTTVNIVLQTSNTQLGEVVVTAKKATIENNQEKLVYNVSTSITATGTDVLTALGKVPGIKVSGNEISVVGKGAVKVMVNDRIIQLAGVDLVRYLKSMSANQISKIELIKNPSANYDAEGNAGLINITTKHSSKQGFSGNVQVGDKQSLHSPANVFGTSNYWLASGSANLNYNSNKWSAYTSVNMDHDHELEGFQTDVFYPKQHWLQTDTGNYRGHNFSAVAGVDYKVSPKTTIGISYLGGKSIYDGSDHVNNPVYSNGGGLDSTLKTFATYHPIAISNSGNVHAIINFDTTGKKLLLNADYINYYRTDRSDFESNSYLPNGQVIPANNTRYFDTNKQNINIYTFKADAEIPTPFAKIAFGGKVSFINNYSNAFYYDKDINDKLTYNTNLSNEFRYIENTQSLYVNLNKEKDKWKYQVGLRAEYTETKGNSYTLNQINTNKYLKLFPSASISYQADTSNGFAFTFGRRVNRPTFWNLNPFKSLFTAYSYGEGNPFLQPEYNSNFELSHTYKNMLTSALFLNITDNGFYNVTVASADTNLVYTVPLNFIKTYRVGVSENLTLHLFPWLDNNNQATFYHTSANSNLSYIKSISGYGAYLATNNTAYFNADKTFAAAINFWYQFPEIDHIGRSDAYYKLDVGFTALAMKKKLNITLNLNDAFRSSASAVSTTVNGINNKFTNFQLNRFVQLALSYRFGRDANTEKRDTGNEDERGRIH
ncbi:outer membrane beta-barrel protein [Mucilaginibacter sp. SP1R1]|uniref:outer membrane beta-barrel protein n=1 Tax=Mucilaginibacter sp. SP1R1 TaxID=2723091 RepID=UPI0016137FED|nr:outer membrane beta-barrel family protein [Mucilaginibacter sp. SP1R1]MBB6147744.1 outer membrane receptor protein involved in Fe transport [Mucilaginibacter sp. SP1R1]